MSSFYIDPAEEPGYAEECDARDGTCQTCDSCGQIANDDEGTPWTFWAELKPPSNMAVTLGLVSPIPCPDCTPKAV